MDYIKEYKSFINSYYLGEGLRITAGVVLPAIVLSYFGLLSIGTVVSLGAISVSITDNPGPIHHRRNGMLASIAINFVVALLTGYLGSEMIPAGILIAFLCFLFSMIGVYGSRVNSIGVSALVMMVLTIDGHHTGMAVLLNALYIAAGGVWYMLLSLALYHVRPYKIIQQALGDCIMATASYLRTRARFYNANVDYETVYRELMEEQVQVQQKHELLRELLFKTRSISKDSTTTGRTLVMIFIDMVDLFEKATTSFYPYDTLHRSFDGTGILDRFRDIIVAMTHELDTIGIDVKAGKAAKEPLELQQQLKELQDHIKKFSDEHSDPRDKEAIIPLHRILQAIEDMITRIGTLHEYTHYDKQKAKAFKTGDQYRQFVTQTDMDPKQFFDNLSIGSNTFRHALRVSVACTVGYVLSNILMLGHSYWILLTIIVILKPAYSQTTKRNYQRLLGTIAGALVGFVILYTISSKTALFVIMLLLMTGTYTFMRTNYLVSVLCMTPYILLVFHLIDNAHFKTIIQDRLVDTGIGSLIAFAANFLLVPAWEHEQIKSYMTAAISSSQAYFNDTAALFNGKAVSEIQYKLSRKNAFVALGNLSEAFSRMLAEPKSKQKDSKYIHQFVVLIHTLTSHIATLAHLGKTQGGNFQLTASDNQRVEAITKKIMTELTAATTILEQNNTSPLPLKEITVTETSLQAAALKPVMDQFLFIARIAEDTRKVCEGMQVKEI
jgi:uncharacterized membrane protein YccC